MLVDLSSWRLVFLINVPVGAVAWFFSRRELVESRAPGRRDPPDLAGAALLAVAIGALTLAIVQGPESGWASGLVIATAAVALVAAGALARRSRSHPAPAIDRELVTMPGFHLNAVMTVVGSAGFFALGLANLLYLMVVWRYTPLIAGLAITPAPFVAAITALSAGRLAERIEPRRLVLAGALVWTCGPLFLLWRMGPHPDYLGAYLPAAVLLAIGVGITFPLVSDAVVSTAPRGRFAGASALNGTIRQLGATMGLAILAALVGSAAETGVPSPYHRAWVFAAACFGFVAAASVGMRPFTAALPEVELELEYPHVGRAAPPPVPERHPGLREVPRHAQTTEQLLAGVPMFASLPPEQLAFLAASCEEVAFEAGSWLFRAGDAADAMYIVRSGRVEVLAELPDGTRERLREMGPGAVVGELALLSGAPRSTSIRIRRDVTLLRLGQREFDALFDRSPGFARSLVQILGGELQASRRLHDEPGQRTRTLAVVSLTGEGGRVQAELLASLERIASLAWLDAQRARSMHPDWSGTGLGHLLDQLELDHELVLLLASHPGDGRWREACVRQADRILVMLDGTDVEPVLLEGLRGCDVALLAPAGHGSAAKQLDALQPRSIQRIATGQARGDDVARLARRLARRSVGLVLSGGGARGFAHIGAVEMLAEAGVRIDRVGGASMGAFVGALLARGLDAAAIDAVCFEEWVRRRPLGDYRFPRRALIKGARAEAMLERTLPGSIEDLALPYYCVSTDIIAAELVAHTRGPLAQAVGASMALPGVVPPVGMGGRLLVDGGVLDNLPVATMSGADEGPVIACDVTEPEQRELAPGDELPRPGIVDTLSRVMLLGTEDTIAQARRHADLLITPADEGVGRLEFHALDLMRESGRRAAAAALESAPGSIWG